MATTIWKVAFVEKGRPDDTDVIYDHVKVEGRDVLDAIRAAKREVSSRRLKVVRVEVLASSVG